MQRTKVVGVVNVTPDSFSDGGLYFNRDDAVRHGFELLDAGADIVDVGGESTRPGAARIDEAEEMHRVLPVVEALARSGATVSIDTTRVAVAERALGAGATIINDVSGARAEAGMAPLAAEWDSRLVVMHWRAHSENMQAAAVYDDVVADVVAELDAQLDVVRAAGVPASNIIVDPGLGFSKTGEHNWRLLTGLEKLKELGYPILVAASRKRFLKTMLESSGLEGAGGTDDATAAITALTAAAGAWAVRVHEVRASRIAVQVCAEWRSREG